MSDVIGWCVYDPETLALVYRCATRDEARELAATCGGAVAVIRRSR